MKSEFFTKPESVLGTLVRPFAADRMAREVASLLRGCLKSIAFLLISDWHYSSDVLECFGDKL